MNSLVTPNQVIQVPAMDTFITINGMTLGNLQEAHTLLDNIEHSLFGRPFAGEQAATDAPHEVSIEEQSLLARNLSEGLCNRLRELNSRL
jgi:hypothetical protein